MSVEADLIQTLYERLTGADSHGQALTLDGSEVPVHMGSGDGHGSYVILDRPRTRGSKFIGGEKKHEVRQQIRVHTTAETGSRDYLKAYDIATEVQSLLEAAPVTVDGKDLHIPETDKQPLPPQDRGDKDALDVALSYVFHL